MQEELATQAPLEVPPPPSNLDTEAGLTAASGFEITDEKGANWYVDKIFGNQLEIRTIEFKLEQEIETLKARAAEKIARHQREIDSLEHRYGHQFEHVCRTLIAGLKKGKTFVFNRGKVSMKKVPAAIEVLDKDAALNFAQENAFDFGAAIRRKPAFTPPPELDLKEFKTQMQVLTDNKVNEFLKAADGDMEEAASDFADWLRREFPFVKVRKEEEKLTVDIG
jgi:phage host-nuclease inhibitor protein Gam